MIAPARGPAGRWTGVVARADVLIGTVEGSRRGRRPRWSGGCGRWPRPGNRPRHAGLRGRRRRHRPDHRLRGRRRRQPDHSSRGRRGRPTAGPHRHDGCR
ncbi:hypothetical protein HBB16_15685 [Pseudonocardia sp. MCCB 268]|nr:hypothetical protein [Pseudonocardia cytotoxica]